MIFLVDVASPAIDIAKNFYFSGLCLGIYSILLLYNLFLFFTIKERSFLIYSITLFFYIIFESVRNDEFAFFVSGFFSWLNYLPIKSPFFFFLCTVVICYLLFARSFLKLKENAPMGNKIILAFVGLFSLYCLIALLGKYQMKEIAYVSILTAYTTLFIISIHCWRKKFRPARFFILADFFALSGAAIAILDGLKIISAHSNFSIFRGDSIGFVLFSITLSFALGDKINILKQEREEAQAKALLHLEAKVKERTEEVTKQKEIIEGKNKDITASIQYAKRIQTALITPENYIVKALKRLMGK